MKSTRTLTFENVCQVEQCGLGYCSRGGGAFQEGGGASPIFWGDCICQNATAEEWKTHQNKIINASAPLGVNQTLQLPLNVNLRWTFWDSSPCPYHNGYRYVYVHRAQSKYKQTS